MFWLDNLQPVIIVMKEDANHLLTDSKLFLKSIPAFESKAS